MSQLSIPVINQTPLHLCNRALIEIEAASTMDYANLATPPVCVADFCLIPIGTPTASVSSEVAAVQRLMKASGLTYSMHSAGTTVEGPWDEVMRLIGQAHTLVHQNGVLRIQSDIRVGTRTDKSQHFSEKVTKVESILAADGKEEQKVIVSDSDSRRGKEFIDGARALVSGFREVRGESE